MSDTNSKAGSVVLVLSAKVARKTNTMSRDRWLLTVLIIHCKANATENVVVDVDQQHEHVRGFICGCRCFDDGHCYQQFMDWEIVDSPNERKGDDSQTEDKLY